MSAPGGALAWLEAREPDIPEALRTRLRDALRNTPPSSSTAAQLAAAALECMRAALDGRDTRASALHLLAADALITHAAEAAALEGTDALRTLDDTLGSAALQRRFLAEPTT